ncbi:sulfite transporter TauE/SafE [Amycolatopsis antarctica]|uniref:Probable membrane transporter protein n=1 Tax=Amycolatopsis antarctica TaxID=1854586 RepID=A0A263D1M2_9PSEU|nr:sulfite exporter TauE/SafE family protein [Amycolatopsis antarctica]OZM72384.1 sulfite transporter TauE/SafE [Amycolatopsis antarctica]
MSTGLLLAGLVVFAGSVVQGGVGFGLNLIAAPILALIDPELVPVPVLLIACAQAGLTVLRERRETHWPGVGWAMAGRLPGNLLGVLALASLPLAGFTIAVGLSVLACVALSLLTWQPAITRSSLVIAGAASGAFGTAASIGGPPMALLYQNSAGPRMRATLGAYFLFSSVSSVLTLTIAGQVTVRHLWAALVLLPFMGLGFLVSSPLRRFLDDGRIRYAVLAVAAGSALLLVARGVFG